MSRCIENCGCYCLSEAKSSNIQFHRLVLCAAECPLCLPVSPAVFAGVAGLGSGAGAVFAAAGAAWALWSPCVEGCWDDLLVLLDILILLLAFATDGLARDFNFSMDKPCRIAIKKTGSRFGNYVVFSWQPCPSVLTAAEGLAVEAAGTAVGLADAGVVLSLEVALSQHPCSDECWVDGLILSVILFS